MHALLQEMIHYVNGLESGAGRDPEKLLEYETRYDQILERALAEYADVPCSDYYRDGFNLATRLKGYRDSHCCSCMTAGYLQRILCPSVC